MEPIDETPQCKTPGGRNCQCPCHQADLELVEKDKVDPDLVALLRIAGTRWGANRVAIYANRRAKPNFVKRMGLDQP